MTQAEALNIIKPTRILPVALYPHIIHLTQKSWLIHFRLLEVGDPALNLEDPNSLILRNRRFERHGLSVCHPDLVPTLAGNLAL